MTEPISLSTVLGTLRIMETVKKLLPSGMLRKDISLHCRTRPNTSKTEYVSDLSKEALVKFPSLQNLEPEQIENVMHFINYVFSNLTISQEDIDHKEEAVQQKKIIKWFNFSRDFHRNPDYFVDARPFVEIQQDRTNKFLDNMKEDYLSSVLSKEIQLPTQRNRLFLIKGDIGSGKSSLLSKTYVKTYDSITKNSQILHKIVMIDFQDYLAKNLYNEDDIEKAFNTLLSRLQNEVIKQTKIKNKKNINIPIIIMLDNLDELYEHYCKLSFFDVVQGENPHESLRKYYPLLYRYLKYFHHQNKSITSGQIINVICCRDDTSDLLNINKQYKNQSCEIDVDTVIKLQDGESAINELSGNKSGSYTKNILIKRMKMLSRYLQDVCPKCSYVIDSNIVLLDKNDIDFNDIDKISVHGLRHTMSLFKIAAFAMLDTNMFQRFFLNKNILRKLHFMGTATIYSQTNEGLVNIFLINREYRLQYLTPKKDVPDYERIVYEKIKSANHLHTYWLKYLILLTISKKINSKQKIISIFSSNYPEGVGCNKIIVQLVLLSLSQVEHGRLVRPQVSEFNTDGEPNDVSIILTKRAKYLLDDNTFFSFGYLANIVEDKWLTFIYPDKRIKGHTEYIAIIESTQNFSNKYIFDSDKNSYKLKVIEALSIKIPLVSLFLDMLHYSLEVEQIIKKDVFLTLNTILKNEKIFDISSIEKNIESELKQIESHVGITDKALLKKWDQNRHPRGDRQEDEKIILAKQCVKEIYKIHSKNPVMDVK